MAEREALRATLHSRGVETYRFGATPHPQLDSASGEEAGAMRDNILCLPVHQQITDSDVEKLSMILRPLFSRHDFSARAGSNDRRRVRTSAGLSSASAPGLFPN